MSDREERSPSQDLGRWISTPILVAVFIAIVVLFVKKQYEMRRHWKPPPARLGLQTLESFGGIRPERDPVTGGPIGFTHLVKDGALSPEFAGLVCAADDTVQGRNPELMVSVGTELSMPDGQRSFPIGTVIYKARYSASSNRSVFAIMRKREPGFDPAHRDWAYLYGESLQPYESGRVERCAACHSKAASQDYVFTVTN